MTEEATGGQATETQIDWTDESVRSAEIQKAVEAAIAGLKGKNSELLGKMDELKALKAEKADRERREAEARGEYDKVLTQERESHAAREKALRSQLEQRLVDAEAMAAITAAGGIGPLLLPHVKARVRVEERDGVFVAVPEGAASISEMVEKMKADPIFGAAFKSTVASGSGASAGSPLTGGVVNPYDKKGKTWNMTEQARLEQSNPTLAKALKAQAGL